jgi:hypothetical protein
MIETQTGINAWADATFGPCTDMRRLLARANQEMAELLSEITMPVPDNRKIAEECADVAHILCRVAGMVGEDLMPIFNIDNLLVPNTIYGPASIANGMLAFILERLSISNLTERSFVGRMVGMIVIKLAEICAVVGTPLGTAVDEKMTVLRTGYHKPKES